MIKKIVFGDPSFTESQEKKRKLFMYLVSGGLTTAANWIVYIIFDIAVKADMDVSLFGFEFSLKIAVKQIIGWIVAVVVAYVLNRITVFRSKGNVFRELITFAGARVISFLVLELGVMYLMIWACEAITGVPLPWMTRIRPSVSTSSPMASTSIRSISGLQAAHSNSSA